MGTKKFGSAIFAESEKGKVHPLSDVVEYQNLNFGTNLEILIHSLSPKGESETVY